MAVVVIGVDPHKASVSIEARDATTERLVATGRFEMRTPGYRQLRAVAKQWPQHVWAIEGTSGTGRPLAQRLLADGETVLDVPAKLAARSRVSTPGRAARPTLMTRMPSSWSPCATRGCAGWPRTTRC